MVLLRPRIVDLDNFEVPPTAWKAAPGSRLLTTSCFVDLLSSRKDQIGYAKLSLIGSERLDATIARLAVAPLHKRS
jgi:hypothetical protein